jgi:hypothetical protein
MPSAVHVPNLIADGGGVVLIRQGDHLRASHTCAAGFKGRLCIHTLTVLQGRPPLATHLIAGSQVVDALEHYVMTGMAIGVPADVQEHHRRDIETALYG